MNTVAIITVNYHSTALIRHLEAAVEGNRDVRLYVVDNSGDFTAGCEATRVIDPGGNIGYGNAGNLAAKKCTEDMIFFINPDLEIDAAAIAALAAAGTEISIWGPLIDDGNGWCSALVPGNRPLLPFVRYGFPIGRATEYKSIYVSGACLCIARSTFHFLGGFYERIFMYAEDLDLCMRAAAKEIEIRTVNEIVVHHAGGHSTDRIWPKFLRLFRSIRGHYRFLSRHFPFATAAISSIYLASGRHLTIGGNK
jgi:N-acetylglucosaminyl-diphospho-decaprenol L-rhamnosyltransferase